MNPGRVVLGTEFGDGKWLSTIDAASDTNRPTAVIKFLIGLAVFPACPFVGV
jgi:hypothetical protein